jgi:2-amino-4-hydroxy-6-hydroxymethyldihydropteridine diphosphokinase
MINDAAQIAERRYFVGVGSNIDPQRNVPRVIEALLALAPTLTLGRVIATAPVGMSGDTFLNLPVSFLSVLTPAELKSRCNAIEIALGRDRSAPDSKVRSRPADLDILFWLDTTASTVDPQLLPTEPYMRPMTIELVHYLKIACSVQTPVLPQGTAVIIQGREVGLAPLTITQ